MSKKETEFIEVRSQDSPEPTHIIKIEGAPLTHDVSAQIKANVQRYFGTITPDERQLIEQEAASLVRNGKRQGTYGHPRGDFDTIAKMWSAILSKSNQRDVNVEAEQVALMMIAMKLSRLARDPSHHDSRVDVIGYAICLDRLDEDVQS